MAIAWGPLVGGIMIGLAAVLLMASLGRIMGVSGIVGAALESPQSSRWQLMFLGGVFLAGLVTLVGTDRFATFVATDSMPTLILAGLLTGFGTRLGSGCTSGHGICGFARLSKRSFAAVGIFMATAILTVALVRLAAGG